MIKWLGLLCICSVLRCGPIQIIEDLIHEYDRPITVFQVSQPIDETLINLSEAYPHIVFIGPAPLEIKLTQDNILAVNETLTVENLNQLAQFEHIDIAFAFGGFHMESNKYQWIEALLCLADNLVLEIPETLHALMTAYCKKIDALIVKRLENNVYILAKRKKPKYYEEQWLDSADVPMPLMSSYHYAIIESQGIAIRLDPGLSLYGFKMLRGTYPKKESLAQLLLNYQWQTDSACLPWNIMVSGKRIRWRKRFSEPLTWSKEGLASCIQGLNIREPKDYTRYTIDECKRLKLN